MTPEQEAVVAVNEAFYSALTNRDLPAMERVWFPADWVECVHPGGIALRGWDTVRESWALLFNAGHTVMVAATEVDVRLIGDVAWVSCTERAAASSEGRIATSVAHATNVFVRHDGEWRCVLHHSSPMPFASPPQPEGGSLVN